MMQRIVAGEGAESRVRERFADPTGSPVVM